MTEEARKRAEQELAAKHEEDIGGIDLALRIGVVDEVIALKETRRKIAEAIASAPPERGWHGNIPL